MTPYAILAVVVLFSGIAARVTWSSATSRDEARFHNAVETTQDRIRARITAYTDLLDAGAGLFYADPDASADDLHRFLSHVRVAERHPGVQGVGFAPRVVPAWRDRWVTRQRERSDPSFRIWPEQPGEDQFPIAFLVPPDRRNAAAIGYDMFSDPVRRAAMERARDTGLAAATSRVTLVQEVDPKKQAGFLIYSPVYRDGIEPETVEERRAAIAGFVYAAFRSDDFLTAIFGPDRHPRVAFDVYDGPRPDPRSRLSYDARTGVESAHIRGLATIDVAGRPWTLDFVSLPSFDAGSRRPLAWVIFIAGCGIGLLLFGLTRAQEVARAEAESLSAADRRAQSERLALLESEKQARSEAEVLNRIGRTLAAELDTEKLVQTITDEATRLTGAEYGAFFRNATNEQGDTYLLFTLSGKQKDRFQNLPSPRKTEIFAATFEGRDSVRLDDVRKDPRFGKSPPHRGFPQGHIPVVSYLAVPVVSPSGEVFGGLFFGHSQPAMFKEVHERIVRGIAGQAAIALDNARLYEAAKDADRRKDEFLAMLAHELRNPLAPIVTSLHLMRLKASDPASQAKGRDVIERQVQRMARLVDDLLDVSRITRGKIQLRREPLDVRAVAERALEATRPLMETRRHRVVVAIPHEPLTLDADALRIEQVLSNLLNNAGKYTEPGGEITLAVREERGQAVISVKDTGIGIPAEALPRMFDLFVQAERTLDRSDGGLGIGLTLVRSLVELHGGTVSAHSGGAGKGSEFVVRLPLASSRPSETPAGGGDAPEGGAVRAGRDRRMRVLVVDDNRDIVETLSEFLQALGHDVRAASAGESALQVAEDFRPHLVLLDIGLPGMDGYKVAEALRRSSTLGGVRIIAISGYAQDTDRRRSREAGFDEHLAKPVDPDRLRSLLGGA